MNLFSRLTFRQRIGYSFGVLIALLALNALVAGVTVLSIIHNMETLRETGQIVNNINQIRISENSFIATLSREHSKRVFELVESTRIRIAAVTDDAGSASEVRGMTNLLDEFRSNFQKFVTQSDQKAALEGKVLDIGRTMVRRIGEARDPGGSLAGGDDLGRIIGQVLEVQWQGQELTAKNLRTLPERVREIMGLLTVQEERIRNSRHTVATRMQLFRIIRDARDYVASFEHFQKYQADTAQTERELNAISGRIQQAGENIDRQVSRDINRKKITYSTLLLFLFMASLVSAIALARLLISQITRPIRDLVNVTREVAQGNLDIRAQVGMQDEIGDLAGCFNHMTENLKRSETALREQNASLELRVRERTENLSDALRDLEQAQQQLVQAEKMAVLGQTIACIAHDINTPLGVIKSSIEHMNAIMRRTIPSLPAFLAGLDGPARDDFYTLLDRVSTAQKTLSTREERAKRKGLLAELHHLPGAESPEQADRIAELLIASGITVIDAVVERIVRHDRGKDLLRMAADISGIKHAGQAIDTAVQRASKVVFALKTYGRIDAAPVLQPIHIIDDIEIVITLYHNLMRNGVELVKEYQPLPEISGYHDALSQVWMNLIQNALQAMSFKGRLTIRTFTEDDRAVVTFNDTGPGIDETVREHIFEPFFTTKPPGEGSGLGLDIVSKIIDEHQGTISFVSQPGDTTFSVSLPIIRQGE